MRFALNIFVFLVFSFLAKTVFSQQPDSTKLLNNEFITDQLENIASSTDLSIDYSDLVDEIMYYSKNPISINTEERSKLLEIRLINENQLTELDNYISEYGSIQSKFELAAIPSFDRQLTERILPFITFSTKERPSKKLDFKNVLKYGKHQLIIRYSQIAEPSHAYSMPNDSAVVYPGSVYLGSPQKYYARYAFDYNKRIRLGFTWEKDAGELISKNTLSDTLLSLVGDKFNLINDFASIHLFVSDLGPVKKAVIGDFHLEFGQGLTLWSGLSFGKSSEATQIKKYGRGITPNTSVNENRFMRGAALTLGFGRFEISGFYSNNNIDGNLAIIDSIENQGVTGIIETGNHRTVNELLDKGVINIQSFGANINYRNKQSSFGITALQTSVNVPFLKAGETYKRFYFEGEKLTNFGFDFNYKLKKINFFGEISATDKSAFAVIIGSNLFLSDRFLITISYRNFSKEYFSFYNNPFREGSIARNEKAYYFGVKLLLASKLSVDAYADFFDFPWLRYGISSPSLGAEYLVQLNYSPDQNLNMYFRFKLDNKQENYREDYDFISKTVSVNRNSFRFNISYSVFNFLILKNRLEMTLYKKATSVEKGYLIYQDVMYRPDNFPLSVSLRYALFSTDGWDSRIYAYENDVLYAFSVPAYYDKGQRIYLMLKLDAFKNVDLWLRVSRTIFRDKTTIGSGADKIDSNHKTEIKLQAKISL